MNISILIWVISISLFLGGIAIFIIFRNSKKKQIIRNKPEKKFLDFEDLMIVVKDKNSSSDDLLEVLKEFNSNYHIDNKNPQKYLIFLSRILTHKNVNKEIFNYFHKNIKKNNQKFKRELDLIERKALG